MENQINSLSVVVPSGDVSYYSDLNAWFQPGVQTGTCGRLAAEIWGHSSIDVLERDIGKCRFLNKKFTWAQLTPLHLAAMQENGEAMDGLLKAGAKIDPKDHRGFTPLHHLALKGNAMAASLLIERGADPTIRNDFNGTYADLLRFNEPFREVVAEWEPDPSFFSAHRADRNTFAPSCLSPAVRKTGELVTVKKTDEVVAKPEALFEAWGIKLRGNDDPQMKRFFHFILDEKYEKFKEMPPALDVRSAAVETGGKPIQLCGLFAKDPIRKGEIIAEYTGEMITARKRESLQAILDTEYLEKAPPSIDAIEYRSPASMANDAFPNAMVISWDSGNMDVEGIDGLLGRKLLVALEDIEPGEQIAINYGVGHTIKLHTSNHVELRNEAVRTFLKEPWEEILRKVENGDSASTAEEYFESLVYREKVQYLFNTYSTFKELIDTGAIKQKDLSLIRKKMKTSPTLTSLIYLRILDAAEDRLKNKAKEL